MKISIAWIAVSLLFLMCLFLSTVPMYKKVSIGPLEGFKSESELDLKIQSCPVDSISYVDKASGRVNCCNGTLTDGTCNGATLCTLSPSSTDKIPTCSEYIAALFEEKGRERCPPSMRHYFENAEKSVKGCCEGARLADGSGPANPSQKTCRLYPTEKEDLLNVDSCTNIRRLELAQCFTKPVPPSVKPSKALIDLKRINLPPILNCSYISPTNASPKTCLETSFYETALNEYKNQMDTKTPHGQQMYNYILSWKKNFFSNDTCDVQRRGYIDNSVPISKLSGETLE